MRKTNPNLIKDMAQLARYSLANAAIRAKNLNEWLTNREVVEVMPKGAAGHSVNQRVQSLVEREDVNLATCVRIISNALAWLPLECCERQVEPDGTESLVPAADHPFMDFWRRPNSHHATHEIKTHLVVSLLTTGNSYLLPGDEVKGSILQPGTFEMWPAVPWQMYMMRDENGRPTGYKQIVGGKESFFDLESVVHARSYNLNDPVYGRSGVEPLKRQLWTEYSAEMMAMTFFVNDGTPRSVLIPDEPVGPEQAQQIEEFYADRANPDDKQRVQIMPVSGKFAAVTPTQKDMEFSVMRKYHRERTFGLIGIPPFLGGVMEYANFANARIQEESFWRHTMIPLANLLADTLTRSILWRRFDEDHMLRFNMSQVEALQGDQVKKAQRHRLYLDGGAMSVNEVRQEIGKEPLDGDEFNLPRPRVANQQALPAPADEKPSKTWADAKKIEIVTRTATGQVTDTKAVDALHLVRRWKAFDATVKQHEEVIEAAFRKFYKSQVKRVLAGLEAVTIEGRFMSSLAPYIRTKSPGGHIDFFLDYVEEDQPLYNLMQPIIMELMEKIGVDATDEARAAMASSATPSMVGIEFDVNNPKVRMVIEQLTNRMVKTNQTTWKAVRGILKRGFDQGSSIQDVAKQIKNRFNEFSMSRAKTIARTEMTGIANSASTMAWANSGATHKTWVATLDDLTRDYHVMYNGERVSINDYFKFGPEPLQGPGDPNAMMAANVINCRCTLDYDFEPLNAQELSDLELQGLAIPGAA